MKRFMIISAVIGSVATAILTVWYRVMPTEWLETIAITMGTITFHFVMRLLVGAAWIPLEHRLNPNAAWFAERRWEATLYKRLRVKSWKAHIPTYDPDTFNIKQQSIHALLCATCHSERVHETIMALSFLPLIATVWFDAFWAFMLTSIGASLIDLIFVIVQRYNRPRLRILLKRQEKRLIG